jgi:alpha-tubulin suppressor-like RCC1 family protein
MLAVLLVLAVVASASGSGAAGALAETPVAPKITKQPVARTVEEGQSAVFEATASGVPAPTVQWEVSTNGGTVWSAAEGGTSNALTIASAKTSENGYRFRATFTNSAGKVTSAAAILTVHKAPVITKQPLAATVEEGQSAVFEAAAAGFPTPTVAWEQSLDGGTTWAAVTGGTSPTLTVASTKTTFSGRLYRATFKNIAGTATTETATLTVRKAPAVTKQPLALTVEEGQGASFEATASGFPAPSVQWQLSIDGGTTWAAVEGATANVLTIASVTLAESGNEYRAVFANAAGEAISAAATLTVHEAPVVTAQPVSATVEEGQSATFEATAAGVPAPTVQWELSTNGGTTWAAVTGATSAQLTIASAKTTESGHEYRATFKNAAGKATTEAATLTVRNAPAVTKQPLGVTVDEGLNAVFEATASGFPTPSTQWELSTDGGGTWSPIEGATASKLTITSATASESGDEYRAAFANTAGTVRSAAATLTVQAPPVVTEQPASTTVEAGAGASFEAAASGFPSPTVQWEVSTNGGVAWSAAAGATSPQLTIAATSLSENGNEYRATFTNAAGKATSAPATLTVASTHYNAFAWGQNLNRQLGDGGFEAYSPVPVAVSGLEFVSAVSAGGNHSLALLADGTVVAWGDNENGQLGNGSTLTSNVPVAVSGLTHVKAIAAGGSHSLALLSNGTVMAWGDDESGQLGNGATAESVETPVAVKGLTGVKAIAAGGSHSLALLSNGTVMAWGANESGQLGTGTVKASTAPVAVKGLSGANAISAGGEFSLALLSNGTVEAWGSNEVGQLGNTSLGEELLSDVPVPVETLTGITAVAAGTDHSLALRGGTVLAWGDDAAGELGNGVMKPSEVTPVAVSGLSGVSAISAGGHDSVALLGGGSLMAWGINRWGTLGDGLAGSPSDVPVAVKGLAKVASVSAGGLHMVAFGEPVPVITAVSPQLGPTSGGNTVTLSGDNFTGATAVTFGTVPATSFTVTSATTATAVVPAGAGTVDVSVTTPSGTSSPLAADRYTYEKPPTVTKLSAKAGPVAGGTSVTITGTEFTGATTVSFGRESASFTVTSSTSITAVAPAQAAGIVDITVTTPGGTSAISTKDHFSYTPTVESVTPSGGAIAGGTTVTVTGTGFALGSIATSFKFGTKKATLVSCASSTSCTMRAPAALAAGTVNVTATVNKASSPLNAPADDFTYS